MSRRTARRKPAILDDNHRADWREIRVIRRARWRMLS
jgi:hypothetical protein